MKKIICDICEQSLWVAFLPDNRLMKCQICGLIRAKINPSNNHLIKSYQKKYFFGEEYINYFNDRIALERNFNLRLNKLNESKKLKQSFLIEIGCAYGYFLNLAKKHTKKHLGFDVSKDGTLYAKRKLGVNALNSNFLNYKGLKADVYCMWDVIEHLPNPNEFIEHISKYSKKGTILSMTTGDIGSFLPRLQGKSWRLIHPPTHLFYFDTQSIQKLLKKHGFKIVNVSHPTTYRNLYSTLEHFKINKSTKIPRQFNSFLKKINYGLNTFDIMNVVAIKK